MNEVSDANEVERYIAQFPEEVQEPLQQIRSAIRAAVPEETTETMKYGLATFVWKGNLVHFGAFTNHIGFYPTPSAITAFQAELGSYVTSKGAVQFPLSEPLPLALVTRMVEFRVAENRSKPQKRP